MEKRPVRRSSGRVTRRDFLKGMGTGALSSAVLPGLMAQDAIPTKKGRVPVFDRKTISLTVNGAALTLPVAANETLLDVLRERLDLTGAKRVCDRGECGGFTVLLDGAPVYACMTLAVRTDGRSVTTVEGLAKGGKLHPVQAAFVENDGYQCGYCTPGFIMTTAGFLAANPSPSLDQIKGALSGNLCRCGNYAKIYKAVAAAADKMKGA